MTLSEAKSVFPEARVSASQRRSWRASSSVWMRHAPVSASVTRQSGAPCVTSAACKAACSRRSRTMRRLISIIKSLESEVWSLESKPTACYSRLQTPDSRLLFRRTEAGRARSAEVERLVLEVFRLHLDRQVVEAELILELRAQRAQKFRLRDGVRVYDVRRKRLAPRSDRPDVQVVYGLDADGLKNRAFDRGEVDVRGRAFQKNVRRLANQIPRTPDDEHRDERAEERVCRVPAEEYDEQARRNRADRAERIAQDVQPRAAHVQVLLVTPVQEPSARQVYDESAHGNQSHRAAALQLRRREPARVSLVENEERDDCEHDAVRERREDFK